MAAETEHERESASELLKQGYLARRESRLSDAGAFLAKAVGAARSSGEQRLLALALAGAGQIARDLGDTANAVAQYEEAVEILRGVGDPQALAHTVRHLGDIRRKREEFAESAACYDETLAIYKSDPKTPPLDLANALRGYALLKDRQGQPREAILLWREAGTLYESVGVEAGVAESKVQIARLTS